MASPICEIREGAGPWTPTTSAFEATPGATLEVRLADGAGVGPWTLTCATTDELSDADTITGGISVDSLTQVATFTAPADEGRAMLLESLVNNGLTNGCNDAEMRRRFKIYTATAGGGEVVCADEKLEGDPEFGWVRFINEMIRKESGPSAPGGTTGQMQYNNAGALAGTNLIKVVGGIIALSGGVVETPSSHSVEANFTSPDGATYSLYEYDLAPLGDAQSVLDVYILARYSTGVKWWKRSFSTWNLGGVFTDGVEKELDSDSIGSPGAWTAVLDRDGSISRVRVAGAAGVKWKCLFQVVADPD